MNQLNLEYLGYNINVGNILLFLGGFSAFCLSLWGGFKMMRLGWMVAAFLFSGWVTQVRAALTMLLISGTALVAWAGHRFHMDSMFNAQVKEYIMAAYKTDDPGKAKKYLGTAQAYLESTGKTEGFTSIAYDSPDEDMSDWYDGIKSATEFDNSEQLTSIQGNRRPWQRKLMAAGVIKEVEDRDGRKILDVNYPGGISAAPYNAHLFWLGIGSLVGIFGSLPWIGFAIKRSRRQKTKANCLCPKVSGTITKVVS